MNFKLNQDQPIPVLSLEGSLMVETESKNLITYVEKEVLPQSDKFIIDLGGLSFLNSSGLGALITILTKCRKSGGEVVIINLNDQITKLLAITKLTSVFTVAPNVEDAVNILNRN